MVIDRTLKVAWLVTLIASLTAMEAGASLRRSSIATESIQEGGFMSFNAKQTYLHAPNLARELVQQSLTGKSSSEFKVNYTPNPNVFAVSIVSGLVTNDLVIVVLCVIAGILVIGCALCCWFCGSFKPERDESNTFQPTIERDESNTFEAAPLINPRANEATPLVSCVV